jgi:uncharacterized protein YxjI
MREDGFRFKGATMTASQAPPTTSIGPPGSTTSTAPVAPPTTGSTDAGLEVALRRNKFLLRQKRVSINEKYSVSDELGHEVLFVERPQHLLQNLGAILAGMFAGIVTFIVLGSVAAAVPSDLLGGLFVLAAVLGGIAACVVVAVYISKKRHVGFYADRTKSRRVLDVLQDKKVQPVNATYTVTDAGGDLLARLSKNHLYNFVRKRWYCHAPDGNLLLIAKEDSILRSILRRVIGQFFGPLAWILRTNFVLLDEHGQKLGEFNRRATLFDRYILDMSADSAFAIDRRIAVALGVMLDAGERR